MTVEIYPYGAECNLSCSYCYEIKLRDVETPIAFNLSKVLEALKKVNTNFTIFGGEPLLLNLTALECLFHWGFEKFGTNGIQTNGTLITDKHIELFKRYNVHVGFSLDGPKELNAARCGSEMTEKVNTNLIECLRQGVKCSLITVIHKINASYLPTLKGWLLGLYVFGLSSVNFHWVQPQGPSLVLDDDLSIRVWLDLYRWSREVKLVTTKFKEMEAMLQDPINAHACCLWKGCDPYTTSGVHGILGDGSVINCGRVNTDGVNWLKGDTTGKERQLVLYHLDQKYNGCKDCRYFMACKGDCPAQAIDGDWRNRSYFCNTLKALFREMEKNVGTQDKDYKPLELEYFNQQVCSGSHGDHHGDHTDNASPHHVDNPHRDSPHIDTGRMCIVEVKK